MAGEKKKETEKVAGKTTSKTAARTSGKSTGKAAGKAANKAAGKTVNKTAGKTTGKTTGKPVEKSGGITSGKTAGILGKGGKSKDPVPKSAPKIDERVFIPKMEQSLLGLKAEITENFISKRNDFKEIVEGLDPKDLADIASDDIDRKIIEALGSQELNRLKLIDSALSRIQQGQYGHCIKCGRNIPQERLEAIPYALMCIECKSEEERRSR